MGKETRPVGAFGSSKTVRTLRERQGSCRGRWSPIHIYPEDVGEDEASRDAKQILASPKAYVDARSSGRYRTSRWHAHLRPLEHGWRYATQVLMSTRHLRRQQLQRRRRGDDTATTSMATQPTAKGSSSPLGEFSWAARALQLFEGV